MFTQAGFNWRRRTICRAYILRTDRGWVRPAKLVRFYDVERKAYGDFAWDGGHGRISWPEQVAVCSFRSVAADIPRLLPMSELPS